MDGSIYSNHKWTEQSVGSSADQKWAEFLAARQPVNTRFRWPEIWTSMSSDLHQILLSIHKVNMTNFCITQRRNHVCSVPRLETTEVELNMCVQHRHQNQNKTWYIGLSIYRGLQNCEGMGCLFLLLASRLIHFSFCYHWLRMAVFILLWSLDFKRKQNYFHFMLQESNPLTCKAVFFYEWEHRTGTMCPFSSLHPSRNGKERQ